MDSYSTKHERTKIWPLRWLANGLMYVATYSLTKAFNLQDDNNFGYRFKIHSGIWHYLSKPYEKWGTYYSLNLNQMKIDMSAEGWNDYDKDGIPYWEKWDKNE